MNILGVEFEARKLNYVLIVCDGDQFKITQYNRLALTETRSRDSLQAFQNAVTTLLNATQPDIIAVKAKPESGPMRAGAAALKMEGILLATASCNVEFVPGRRINTCANGDGITAYHQSAFKAAAAAHQKQVGENGRSTGGSAGGAQRA